MIADDPPIPTTSTEFKMPSLGADMRFGTVVAWLVKPGDVVKRGDIVAEVETEKGVFEVEIGVEGTVDEITVTKGSKVPVGTTLARLRGKGAAAGILATAPPGAIEVSAPAVAVPVSTAPSPAPPAAPHAVRASPLARKVAEAEGIDLASVVGTGPGGAITKADVERAAPSGGIERPPPVAIPAAVPSPPSDTASAMRHAVAAAVARSKREIPHYYLAADVDLATAIGWLAARNASRPITDRILPAALLLRSVALALRAYPLLNGFWIDDAYQASASIHLGVAISLRDGGLLVPAIHDADRLGVEDLMRALTDLVRRTRSGGLRSSEMVDATVTVSNLGDQGATSVFGIIYPPQVALVGFGRVYDRPWADRGMLGVRPVVTVSLAADHRATDGHYGGRFLADVSARLQTPESL